MKAAIGLHGFLGKGSDWNRFDDIDGFDTFKHEITPFWTWAKNFNNYVVRNNLPRRLIGYSLGGRLALHALINNPKLWEGAVIISTHPGLKTENERCVRLESDEAWANRFANDDWDPLITDWNNQGVFDNKDLDELKRVEKDFDRTKLCEALTTWSLAEQEDLSKALLKIDIPILWMVGEYDSKFREIANKIVLSNKRSEVWIAPKAYHRVPWEIPEMFNEKVNRFFCKLNEGPNILSPISIA